MRHAYISTINNETREATMRLYGTIGEKVDGDRFAQELASLDGLELDHIRLRINTPGGNVFQGMSIVSAMLSMKTPVHSYIDGVAASMGAVVAVSASRVYMADFAKMMIHDPYFAGTDNTETDKKARRILDKVSDMLRQVLSRRGKKEAEIARLMKEETWFSADEARRAGLCDEVVPSAKAELKALTPMQLVAVIDAGSKAVTGGLRPRLIAAFGLAESATDEQIIQAVTDNARTPEKELEKALQMGFIDNSQLTLLRALGRSDTAAFRQFLNEKEKGLQAGIDKELDKAVQSGKIIVFERNVFENIGKRLGLNTLKGILGVIPERIVFSKFLKEIRNDAPNGLSLTDYRKYAPQALADDPELYARLLAQERGESEVMPEYGDLGYFRKNHPEYLKNNPDEYKRLIQKEKEKGKK